MLKQSVEIVFTSVLPLFVYSSTNIDILNSQRLYAANITHPQNDVDKANPVVYVNCLSKCLEHTNHPSLSSWGYAHFGVSVFLLLNTALILLQASSRPQWRELQPHGVPSFK